MQLLLFFPTKIPSQNPTHINTHSLSSPKFISKQQNMRNQWRLLLRCNQNHNFLSPTNICRPLSYLQVTPNPSPLSSFSPHLTSFPSHFHPSLLRHFSSVNEKSTDPLTLISVFTNPINGDEIKKELDANNVVFTPDLVTTVLKNLNNDPKTAIKFFDWALERENGSLSCKGYNFMLGVLGSNGLFKEFWDLLDLMRQKGYGVRKGTFDKVLEKFEKEGSQFDVEKLKGLYSKDVNGSIEFGCARVSNIMKRKVWDVNVEEELKGLGVSYSSELVKMVLKKLREEPMKGLIFFRWLEESGLFKHDQETYNAMAVALGRRDCFDRFWNVVEEMRNAGYELEMETYVEASERFIKKMMVKDAVGLYEYMMNGANKLSRQDCTLLLRKVVVAKKLDMELFSRVVKKFTEDGSALDDSMLDSVLKSLTSVGRMNMYSKVLDAMVECGFKPSGPMQGRVAFDLSSTRMKDEASEFMVKLEGYGLKPYSGTWASLIEGHCVGGDLEKARKYFENMVKREGSSSSTVYTLDLLVNAFCNRERAADICKVLSDLLDKEDIKPSHDTYKTLISKLLTQKGFKEALNLFGLMKKHGFPPFLDPFIAYLAKRGTPDEAMMFFKAMTVKNFPSTNVFLRVLKAYLEAGRHQQAHNLLAKCPQYIRNHSDVLYLFCSMKPEKPAKSVAVAVA